MEATEEDEQERRKLWDAGHFRSPRGVYQLVQVLLNFLAMVTSVSAIDKQFRNLELDLLLGVDALALAISLLLYMACLFNLPNLVKTYKEMVVAVLDRYVPFGIAISLLGALLLCSSRGKFETIMAMLFSYASFMANLLYLAKTRKGGNSKRNNRSNRERDEEEGEMADDEDDDDDDGPGCRATLTIIRRHEEEDDHVARRGSNSSSESTARPRERAKNPPNFNE